MPTDGTDFGRMKACYGKAYSAAAAGAAAADVSRIVVDGIERDIRRDGGCPAFVPAVELIRLISLSADPVAILSEGAARMNREYGDFPLTRYVVEAARQIGLEFANHSAGSVSQMDAAAELLTHLCQSRFCDNAGAYVSRSRSCSLAESQRFMDEIAECVGNQDSLKDMAFRRLCSSKKGLPVKAQKLEQVVHSADALNDLEL